MRETLRVIRIFFLCLCVAGGFLVYYAVPEWEGYRWVGMLVGFLIGVLVILVDILLKGFSLRGLSALTFGLAIGWLVAAMIANSPLFEFPFDPDDELSVLLNSNQYLIRMTVYVVLMYLGAVLALRGRDEFNLVIPYVRFVPHGVDVPLAVVDASALIDGRIVAIAEAKFLGHALVIPRFIIEELQRIADSPDMNKQAAGRRGLDALNRLRAIESLDLRINESTVDIRRNLDAKIVFLAQSLKAKILTTDFNLAQIAEFHSLEWLNINALAKALHPEVMIGETFFVKLVRPGKEADQAVGYLNDGSMVVVMDAAERVGEDAEVRVESVVPSAGGKIVFARLCA
jgi:uncharacterized protein YacL